MPAEWEAHARTWMAFPPSNPTFGEEGSDSLTLARIAWTEVARVIAEYEPVTMIAQAGDGALAARLAGPTVEIDEQPLDDAWMRDIGPSFTIEVDGGLGAVDWVFNGWGGQDDWAVWESDRLIGAHVGRAAGASLRSSSLVNEGGGLQVDGAGTILLTETVQCDPGRNPDWTRAQVEAEVHAQLGTTRAIWLPRGLTGDYEEYGTRGHVDIVACFTPTGLVLVHSQLDPRHPDHAVSRDIAALLRASTGARGRPLEVVELPAPTVGVAGRIADYSYVNHYVGNGFVLVGLFGDPADEAAVELLRRAYPGRSVRTVDGRPLFAFGGGVHCITQQQPAIAAQR